MTETKGDVKGSATAEAKDEAPVSASEISSHQRKWHHGRFQKNIDIICRFVKSQIANQKLVPYETLAWNHYRLVAFNLSSVAVNIEPQLMLYHTMIRGDKKHFLEHVTSNQEPPQDTCYVVRVEDAASEAAALPLFFDKNGDLLKATKTPIEVWREEIKHKMKEVDESSAELSQTVKDLTDSIDKLKRRLQRFTDLQDHQYQRREKLAKQLDTLDETTSDAPKVEVHSGVA
jgi:uncharacterized protein YukE